MEDAIKLKQEKYIQRLREELHEIKQAESEFYKNIQSDDLPAITPPPSDMASSSSVHSIIVTPAAAPDTPPDINSKNTNKHKTRKYTPSPLKLSRRKNRIRRLQLDDIQTGFVYNSHVGYLTSNPQYFGTAMRVYVTLKLPLLLQQNKFDEILELQNLTAFQHNVHNAQQMFFAYQSQFTLPRIKRNQSCSSSSDCSAVSMQNTLKSVPLQTDSGSNQVMITPPPPISSATSSNSKFPKVKKFRRKGENKNIFKKKMRLRSSSTASLSPTSPLKYTLDSNILKNKRVSLGIVSKHTPSASGLSVVSTESSTYSVTNDDQLSHVSSNSMENIIVCDDGYGDNVLIHDDEDLGDVIDPALYREEVTVYQTVSLGISEVQQVRGMVCLYI